MNAVESIQAILQPLFPGLMGITLTEASPVTSPGLGCCAEAGSTSALAPSVVANANAVATRNGSR